MRRRGSPNTTASQRRSTRPAEAGKSTSSGETVDPDSSTERQMALTSQSSIELDVTPAAVDVVTLASSLDVAALVVASSSSVVVLASSAADAAEVVVVVAVPATFC